MALTNSEADHELPVTLEATVTYVRPAEKNLFVADGGFAVYCSFALDEGLQPGDRVLVRGHTHSSFRPLVKAAQVKFLHHGSMPPARLANFSDLIRSRLDSQLVQIDGHVMAATLDGTDPDANLRIKAEVAGGTLEGIILHAGRLRPIDVLDSEIRMKGVAGGAFDSKMQMAGVWLDMFSPAAIQILRPPAVDPWSLPVVPTDEVVFAYRKATESERVHISGTLTYFEPGSLAVIERQGKAMLVKTMSMIPLNAGAGVEATGFPQIQDVVQLDDAQLRAVAQPIQVHPQTISWEDASVGLYAYNLVSMEGVIVGAVHDARVDLFVLLIDGHLFSASVRRGSSDALVATKSSAMPPIGSRVRVTGVCFVDAGNHWNDRLWFDLRMRSIDDLVVLRNPTWWSVRHLAYTASILCMAVLTALLWGLLLERRLRAQSAILTHKSLEEAHRERRLNRQEQQRSHILELISSSKPLSEILDEIQSVVSARLGGGRCWFELEESPDAAPPKGHHLSENVFTQELLSAQGVSFGFILAEPLDEPNRPIGPDADIPESEVAAALLTGARIATLAIDTRRLYSDLRRRSEYDLLTDIPNRFSMERRLNEMMEMCRCNDSMFGLIYMDLDHFKQINDRYGHRTGDLFLQRVTQRMTTQLRACDVLARIGGDEFIALAPNLKTRSDAEEIMTRLERCLDAPIEIEGLRLSGSVSVGLAIYPEDGETQEEVQRHADSAMYANKQGKKHVAGMARVSPGGRDLDSES